MSDTVSKSGSITIVPTTGSQDGVSNLTIPLDSSFIVISRTDNVPYLLTTDAWRPISLGPCVKINWIRLRVIGGWCLAQITGVLGGVATLTVEPELEIRSDSNPYTSLSLQRPPAQQVQVVVTFGDKG